MQEKKRGRAHSRWLLPAALVLAGAAWFENFTLSTSTVTAACAALPEAFSGLRIVSSGKVRSSTSLSQPS